MRIYVPTQMGPMTRYVSDVAKGGKSLKGLPVVRLTNSKGVLSERRLARLDGDLRRVKVLAERSPSAFVDSVVQRGERQLQAARHDTVLYCRAAAMTRDDRTELSLRLREVMVRVGKDEVRPEQLGTTARAGIASAMRMLDYAEDIYGSTPEGGFRPGAEATAKQTWFSQLSHSAVANTVRDLWNRLPQRAR